MGLLVFILTFSCQVGGSIGRAGEVGDLIQHYQADHNALRRKYNLEISLEGRDRMRRFFETYLQQLHAVDFDGLHQAEKIDWLLMKGKLDFELGKLRFDSLKLHSIEHLIPFGELIVDLEQGRRSRRIQKGRDAAEKVQVIIERIDEVKKRIEKEKKEDLAADPVEGRRAAMVVDELRRSLRNWADFYKGFNPEFTWWIRKPVEIADKALEDYAWFLREKLAGYSRDGDEPVIGDPIGREALLEALSTEMIAYTPEELIAIAEKEFDWCDREMKRAATDLGFNGDWSQAMDYVSRLHVEPGDQPKLIVRLADEATTFLEERDLLTVPDLAKEVWRMEMMPEARQKVTPYFTGGEVISISYPTENMNHEDKLMSMRGNNIHFSRATVHHELIPGHHLQLYMAERYNTQRRLFRTPFLIEGWALYWEMLLWDLEFQRSAEDRVGMLFWRSHRCARILFSLRFHLGEMTAQEAIDFLVERVGHERRNATAEVRRSVAGDYGPLYQAAYMVGGLQIRALHQELVQTGRMPAKEFHDAILKENAIPIAMIRASLTGETLTKDYQSEWRFYQQF